MRIALAQYNFQVGNFTKNKNRIKRVIAEASEAGVDLLVFSELAVCGYPPLDLLEYHSFVEKSQAVIEEIAPLCRDLAVIVGAPSYNKSGKGKALFNSAYFLKDGKVFAKADKALLPTYDVFDEYRYFEQGRDFSVIPFKGKKIALTICEDIWMRQPRHSLFGHNQLYQNSPLDDLAAQGADLLINIAASPYSYRQEGIKEEIFRDNLMKYQMPLIYVNQVGANTEIIFDGASRVINKQGKTVLKMLSFEEDFRIFNLEKLEKPLTKQNPRQQSDYIAQIRQALVLGIRDFFQKLGFSDALVGLSGGIDSAVVLVLAAEALGPEHCHALLMPSPYSSEHSVSDAKELAANLGVTTTTISISDIFHSFRQTMKPLFKDLPEDITEENMQARIRGSILMAYSNKFGNILLNTTNKSEAAVGYGTLYGDMNGSLSVLGDIYKTDVYKLARFINEKRQLVPVNIISKPPSAELRPDQKDSDSLPDYEILDAVLYRYIELKQDAAYITAEGFKQETVDWIIKQVNRNEYKRFQTPPILRVSSKAFGMGRRIPLTAVFES